MEWEEYFADGASMVVGAQQRIAGEDKPIRYVNGRYKLRGQSESAWLYDISYEAEGDHAGADRVGTGPADLSAAGTGGVFKTAAFLFCCMYRV